MMCLYLCLSNCLLYVCPHTRLCVCASVQLCRKGELGRASERASAREGGGGGGGKGEREGEREGAW